MLTRTRAKQATHLQVLPFGPAKKQVVEGSVGCKYFDDKVLMMYQLTKHDTAHNHTLLYRHSMISASLESNSNVYIPPQICPTLPIAHRACLPPLNLLLVPIPLFLDLRHIPQPPKHGPNP